MRNKIKRKTHAMIHAGILFLRRSLIVLNRKTSESGLSNRIWKFMLTAGCSEKIIANRMMPQSPVTVRMNASMPQNVFFRCRSMMVAIINMIANAMAHMRGVISKKSAYCILYGEKTHDDCFTRGRLVWSTFTITALSKSLRKLSGRNCCSCLFIGWSALMPNSRSLPNRAQRWCSLYECINSR